MNEVLVKVFFRVLNAFNAASKSEKGAGTTFSCCSSPLICKLHAE